MRTILFLSLLLFFSSPLFSQNEALFTPDKRKAFANYLFSEKDYLRATEEYGAINRINQNDSLSYNIGLCYLKMNEFEEAKEHFYQLRNSSLGEQSKLLFIKSSYLLNKKLDVNEDSVSIQFVNQELQISFKRLELAAKIKYGMKQTTVLSFNDFEESDAQILKKFVENFSHPQTKSPFAAALFSACIPGAGKIYTENYGDGITSFIVTGLLAFLTWDNLLAHHNTRAWIFAGATAFFTAGNIYGSYISARNYNLEKEEELNNKFDSFLSSKNYFIPAEIEGNSK